MNQLFSRCDPAAGHQDCEGTPAPPSPTPSPVPPAGCLHECGLNGDCDEKTNTCICDNG